MLDLICDERLQVLDNLIENTSYCKTNPPLFLSKYSKSIVFATPDDIRKLFVAKDSKGKIKIHDIICPNLKCWYFLLSLPFKAGLEHCPNYVRSIKKNFESYGKGSRWDGDSSLEILSVVNRLKDTWRL